MPTLAVGDVVTVTQFARYQGQRVLNVFHYGWAGSVGADYDTELNVLLSSFRSNVWQGGGTIWKNSVVDTFTIEFWRAQKVVAGREYYLQLLGVAGDAGTIAATGCPSDVNLTISLRSASIIRGTTGNKKLTGIPSASISGNLWDAGTLTTFQAISNNFKANLPDSTAALNWGPLVWSPRRAADRRPIVATTARPEVRVLRKREYGKGV